MTDIRLLISDVDGTLVRSDKTLSDAVIAAAGRLEAAGIMMSLISARPPSGIGWIAGRLGLKGAIGAFNGGTLLGGDGSILRAERLAADTAAAALSAIDRPDVIKWLFADGQWHTDRLDDHYTPRERRSANQEPVVCTDFGRFLDRVDKIVAVSADHAMLAGLEAAVAGTLGDGANVARSQPYYLDITAPAANKGDGVAALAEAAGVTLDEVVVIGDQYNDLPMFRRAGRAIAMGQAPEDVRRAAADVTDSNDEDGVASAIDRLLAR
ncbi:Cof-type HAD-IIB family hydrolase [Sphingomonas quercus]|uniref:Cof-type HAD-IIB family hydrolase n=1 Tax=Sphingomonas quercus TaxID=2842451 RepID=A0ABS6BIT6_9SPHN|nr:Cof-type HAD-IIB family hydrolase [Sphingomonas quercus]MBU3078094.1 Cof-type HAD-IIB family hydrolase [Sphingomonas quercus]